jgi:hypothetical protein
MDLMGEEGDEAAAWGVPCAIGRAAGEDASEDDIGVGEPVVGGDDGGDAGNASGRSSGEESEKVAPGHMRSYCIE